MSEDESKRKSRHDLSLNRMEERKSFLLRISPALWKEVEAWAQEDMRSVNAQIEFLLKQAVVKRRSSSAEGNDMGKSGKAT
jgi:hypothetical protein